MRRIRQPATTKRLWWRAGSSTLPDMSTETPRRNYQWLNFNSPMTDETADRLVAQLAATEPSQIVDIGCGWAELLLRLLEACPTASGHGIDHNEALIERAIRNATKRSVLPRVTFSSTPDPSTPRDLVLCVGSEHIFGTYVQALSELRTMVRPGGTLLLGAQIWERPPTDELVEAMGEVPDLTQLLSTAATLGWRPLDLKVASADDWDHFEFGFLKDWEHLVMSPVTSAEAEAARRAADRHRQNYLQRRGIFGFAFVTLGWPKPAPVP